MKIPTPIILAVSLLAISPDISLAQSQVELNSIAEETLKESDAALNEAYKALMSDQSRSPKFKADLRDAQRAWMTFIDRHMLTAFPLEADEDPREQYGSSYAMEFALEKTKVIDQRVIQLRELHGEVDSQPRTEGHVEEELAEISDPQLPQVEGEPDVRIVKDILSQVVRYNYRFIDKLMQQSEITDAFNLKMAENKTTNIVIKNKYVRNIGDERIFVYDLRFTPVTYGLDKKLFTSPETTLVLGLVKRGNSWYQTRVPE